MPHRIDLNDIRLLMRVVQHGSYMATSAALGIPKSTISQRIAGLEKTVGTGLLRRTSRRVSLTEAGALLLPHARSLEDLARRIERSLHERGPMLQGTLRISCSNALAQEGLAPLLPRFFERHALASLRVETAERTVDLIGEGFDMVIHEHVEPLKDSIIVQRVVARAPWMTAASPDWIAAHGAPSAAGDVSAGMTLSPVAADDRGLSFRRSDAARGLGEASRFVSDDRATLRAAAVAGAGVVCLPRYMLRNSLRTGALVPVLADRRHPVSTVSVLTPPRGQSSRLASAFSDFLAAELPRLLQS